MTSIALAVFIIGIIYVMIWCIRNDGVRSIREQTGLISMRVPPEVDATEGAGQTTQPKRPVGAKRAGTGKQIPAGPQGIGDPSSAQGRRRPRPPVS